MLGPQIPLKPLSLMCRSLSTMLHSGVPVLRSIDLAADKSSDNKARFALNQVSDSIRRGEDIATSMRAQHGAFPDLMIDMIAVAEQTGSLPEILSGLSNHYDNNLRLRKEFISAIAWPVFQFIAAVLVIALMLYVLGIIAAMNNDKPLDILGWGLTGSQGAIIWLSSIFGSIFALFFGYQVLSRSLPGKKFLHPTFMRIPVLGTCMQSFGIARFSWSFYLTQEAGMPIEKSLAASFQATANGAFINATSSVNNQVMSGSTLTEALGSTDLFPADFMEMVHVGETSGTVPEMLNRMSPQFEDQARRSLNALAATLGWLVWLVVAVFIIYIVFTIALWYVGMINDAIKLTSL